MSSDLDAIESYQPHPTGGTGSTDLDAIAAYQPPPTGVMGFIRGVGGKLQEIGSGGGYLESRPDPGGGVLRNLGGFDTSKLNDNQKKAAIVMASMALPSTLVPRLLTLAGEPAGFARVMTWLAGTAGEGAAIGGGTQALSNLASGAPVTQDVGNAAALGGIVNTGVGMVGKGVPVVSQAAKRLMDQGIVPTVGQAVEGSNTLAGKGVNWLEQAMGSNPFTAAAVRNARQRGAGEWRNSILDKTAPEGTPPLSGGTQDRYGQIKDVFDVGYDAAAQGVDMPVGSQAFRAWKVKMMQRLKDPDLALGDAKAQEIFGKITDRLQSATRDDANGMSFIPGDVLKGIESDIGYWQRSETLGKGTSPFDARNTGQALGDIRQGLQDARGQLFPESAAQYARLDPVYAGFKPVENAIGTAAGNAGDFTPLQLLSELNRGNKPAAARGGLDRGGLQNELRRSATDARQVFKPTLGDSGSADRILPYLMATGGVGALGLAAAPVAALGSTRIAQQGLLGMLRGAETVGPAIQHGLAATAPTYLPDQWLQGY